MARLTGTSSTNRWSFCDETGEDCDVRPYREVPCRGHAVDAAPGRIAPLVNGREPGCTLYPAIGSQENPDDILLCGIYADDGALQSHRETPHFREIIEGTVVPLLERRERELPEQVVG